jgi:Shikimate / quinate 5-dehydrogenase
VTTVLLVGAGAVGVRAARQLLDTPGVDRVLVAARQGAKADEVAAALSVDAVPYGTIPDGVDAVALAVPGSAAVALAAEAVSAGVSVAAACDDREGVTGLLELDAPARERGVNVVAGCALAPGLTDVLACHAANALDEADEIHVARAGAAGEACATALRRARRERPVEWSDGAARVEPRLGPELVWFPDPVGARECVTVAGAVETLHEAVPTVRRATMRAADVATPKRRVFGPRRAPEDEWAAVRVEVWGSRSGAREGVVYGVLEHPAVAAGTVLGVAAARVAGLLPELRLRVGEPGARALGAHVEPPPFLAELARRGVKAAAFEGATTA